MRRFFFSDLSSAFPFVVRRLAVRSDITDVEMANRLKALNFTPQIISDALEHMRRIDVWTGAVALERMTEINNELLIETWLAMERRRGPRRRILFFTASFSHFLETIRVNLVADHLVYVGDSPPKDWSGDDTLTTTPFVEVLL